MIKKMKSCFEIGDEDDDNCFDVERSTRVR